MPVISPTQFIQLADRLAATYELLVAAETRYMAPPNLAAYRQGEAYPARLLFDLTGTGTQVLFTAKATGVEGNSIYFSIVPGAVNAMLESRCLGTNLVLALSVDDSGQSNTPVEDAINFLKGNPDFTDHVNIIYPVSGTGGVVQPRAMTALSGGIGTGTGTMPLFTLTTTRPGPEGNNYTLTMIHPSGNNQLFDVCWNRNDLVITLPTDGAGALTETLAELQMDLAALTNDFWLITDSPNTLAPAVPTTPFSGGGIGSFAQVVLTPAPGSNTGAVDPDVAKALMTPAQLLDENFTAVNLCRGADYILNMQAALVSHFLAVGYSGGLAGYLTDNSILVHKNFSTINSLRTGTALSAANVFRPDQVVLGTVVQGASAVTFTAGTDLGSGEGAQSDTNYGAQRLEAVLVAGAPLAGAWSFTLALKDGANAPGTSDPVVFPVGSVTGATVPVTAGSVVRFIAVSGATQVTQGANGDQVFITQVVERQISL